LTLRPRPGRAALLEHRYANHADVAVIAAPGRVRISHFAEAEGCHLLFAATEAVNLDRRPRRHQVAALFEGAGLTVDHVQAVNGGDGLEARSGLVLDANRVARAVPAH